MGKLGAAGAVLALTAWPLVASAQPKPTPAQIQQAGELVKKAIAKSQAGDHELAIELYKQAFDIIPQPILLSNIGSEYEQDKKPVQALKYFCKYLDADPTGSNASYATAKAKALQIDLGNPPPDDASVCKPPAPKPVPEAPPTAPGPAAGSTIAPVTFEPTGGPTKDSGDDHPGRALEYAGAGIGVVGVVGLALGSVFASKAESLNDQINNHNINTPWPSQIDGVPIKDWDTQGAAWNRDTYIFMIGGAVALGAGIGLFVYGASQGGGKTETSVSLVPTANGFAAFGRF
jgi:tetratricopeptide (TPR) repeat protein